ncbi:MAG: hypothetical protein RL760_574 [Candidatus Eisenbacteria bacterium]
MDLNPQREQMADESMVRNLAFQIEAIWPQELALFERYALAGPLRILDAGCGTGQASGRLATRYPQASVLGVDILDHHLDTARAAHTAFGERVTFEHRSVFETGLPEAIFDLTVCRHVVQSIPFAERALAELVRVTRPGGWLHVIAEDYDMLHFPLDATGVRDFWHEVVPAFMAHGGYDLCIGRRAAPLLAALGLEDVRLDYVTVDTVRVPRATFAGILEAWRDGYAVPAAEVSSLTVAQTTAAFDPMIAAVRDPDRYALWQVPVVSGRVPA